MLSRQQRLQLDKLRLICFNNFDGNEVANLLMDHRHLWDGFIVASSEYSFLGELRNIHLDNDVQADYIWMKTDTTRVRDLVKLLERARASEIGWMNGRQQKWNGVPGSKGFSFTYDEVNRAVLNEMAHDSKMVIVRVFWD